MKFNSEAEAFNFYRTQSVEAMQTRAAQIATQAGIDMVIANGSNPETLYEIVEGKEIGTRFLKGEVTA